MRTREVSRACKYCEDKLFSLLNSTQILRLVFKMFILAQSDDLLIDQTCGFDCSGSQVIKILKKEGRHSQHRNDTSDSRVQKIYQIYKKPDCTDCVEYYIKDEFEVFRCPSSQDAESDYHYHWRKPTKLFAAALLEKIFLRATPSLRPQLQRCLHRGL